MRRVEPGQTLCIAFRLRGINENIHRQVERDGLDQKPPDGDLSPGLHGP